MMIQFLLRLSRMLKNKAQKWCSHRKRFLFNGDTPACPTCGAFGKELLK